MPKCPYCGNEYKVGEELCAYCGRQLHPEAFYLSPGTLLHGRYEIEKHVKEGGMGIIYYAEDKHAESKRCVVKQLKEPVTSNVDLDKLREEARRMAQLKHTRVAEILEDFVEDNRFYIVVEYVDGKTLEEVFNEQSTAIEEATVVSWGIQICRILKRIHSYGVIHRDISPCNLMLNDMGDIIFIDFGTLRELKHVATGGTAGVGKFGYTPPEQWAGKPVPQSDIFALGATLYYLLSGFLPLSREYRSGGDPQPGDFKLGFPLIRTKNSKISKELEQALSRALQLDVDRRYQSAEKMSLDLENVTGGTPVISAKVSSPPRPSASLKCPKCSQPNKPHLIYCKYCEAVLQPGSRQCIKCYSSIPVNAPFCPECGAKQ